MKHFKQLLNLALCVGVVLVFNESDTLLPNLIGLACLALLVGLNGNTNKSEEATE